MRQPLRLAYAIKGGWEPGVWTAADLRGVDQGLARRKYLPAFLVK
ncbi:MAG TPA: hypothetical protein VFS70_00895 [Actinomycetota bacterium]|nr:hypothetical protein [Actinomycetota bacterium]